MILRKVSEISKFQFICLGLVLLAEGITAWRNWQKTKKDEKNLWLTVVVALINAVESIFGECIGSTVGAFLGSKAGFWLGLTIPCLGPALGSSIGSWIGSWIGSCFGRLLPSYIKGFCKKWLNL